MKNYVLTALLTASLGLAATATLAGHHEGGEGHKGKKMMERVDTNADGVVSKAEFMAKHEEMFIKMDADANGELTKDEMKNGRKAMKEKMKERMKEKSAE
jgi:hypothetical protein